MEKYVIARLESSRVKHVARYLNAGAATERLEITFDAGIDNAPGNARVYLFYSELCVVFAKVDTSARANARETRRCAYVHTLGNFLETGELKIFYRDRSSIA